MEDSEAVLVQTLLSVFSRGTGRVQGQNLNVQHQTVEVQSKSSVKVQTAAASVSVYRFVCHLSIAYICSAIVYVTGLLILSELQLD